MATLRRDSTEYVSIPITAPVDIDSDVVEVAFVHGQNNVPADWFAATVTDGVAKVLVGPDGVIELTPQTWYVVVRVTDSPEVPVVNAGALIVT